MNDRADPSLAAGAPQAAEAGRARPHESAALHAAGAAPYVDDLPEWAGTLHAALGLSPCVHARLLGIDTAALRRQPGVVAVLTAADIPGPNDCGPIVADDPILAEGTLRHVGQPVFAVVATTREAARRAAALAATVLRTEPLPARLDAREAHAHGEHVLPSMHLLRESAPGARAAALAAAPHRVRQRLSVGGQEQFYLEGQISYALPQEDGGLKLLCSTQHPSEMQHLVARALGSRAHRVQVECRRMGGGFGGKESQSALFACVAALAAQRLQRPVKLRLDRDDDFLATGRRHGFEIDVEAGFDDAGRVLAVEATLVANAGCSADLSGPVMTRALCHFDNAYWLPEVALHGHLARTHTQSNTAFRGFGGPQGAIAIETLLDAIARRLGRDPLDVRRANFYGAPGNGDLTPYGQRVDDNVLEPLVAQLAADSGYAARRAEIAAFNAASPVLKRGLALTPVKFGIAFNLAHLNQAGALVHVYTDGSVLVNHGGTEMGQGLHTKVAQVVAHELGIAFDRVRVSATDTHKVPNTSATAASTGSDLNGFAAQDAARRIRERLAAFAARRFGTAAVGAASAATAGGAAPTASAGATAATAAPSVAPPAPLRFADDAVWDGAVRLCGFDELVREAYLQRVPLWSDGHYATPGLHWDRETLRGRPFHYYAYGAAVSEVLVDTLSGEHRLLRADLLHDVGRSLNPALDLGQIEGAFVQGMGWLTSEELHWHPLDGSPHAGALETHAPSTYKIPTANDVPAQFSVRLFDNANAPGTLHLSKAVGEPPLLLAISVFLALRDAVAAAGGPGADPPLRAPATPEAVLDALDAVRAAPGAA